MAAAAATAIHLLPNSSKKRTLLISNHKLRTTQISVLPKASASTENSNTGKKKKSNKTGTKSKNKQLKETNKEEEDKKNQIINKNVVELEKSGKGDSTDVIKRLDDVVNPVGLGRKSRQIFDQVWKKFSNLGQISRTEYDDGSNLLVYGEGAPLCEFTIPGAQNTTVLVVGATSRIGRLVIRKLMLRGYTVKVVLIFCLVNWFWLFFVGVILFFVLMYAVLCLPCELKCTSLEETL